MDHRTVTNMTRLKSGLLLLSVVMLASCDYEKNAVQDIAGVPAASGIRFFNFGPIAPALCPATSPTPVCAGLNFYANDTKMTAVSTATCSTGAVSEACTTTGAEATTGLVYGGVGGGGLYSSIDPGQYTFTARIAATVDKNLAVASTTATIDAGK